MTVVVLEKEQIVKINLIDKDVVDNWVLILVFIVLKEIMQIHKH